MPGALNPLRMGIRSETAEAVQPGLNDLWGGAMPPFSMRVSTDGGVECCGANISSSLPEGVNAS